MAVVGVVVDVVVDVIFDGIVHVAVLVVDGIVVDV